MQSAKEAGLQIPPFFMDKSLLEVNNLISQNKFKPILNKIKNFSIVPPDQMF